MYIQVPYIYIFPLIMEKSHINIHRMETFSWCIRCGYDCILQCLFMKCRPVFKSVSSSRGGSLCSTAVPPRLKEGIFSLLAPLSSGLTLFTTEKEIWLLRLPERICTYAFNNVVTYRYIGAKIDVAYWLAKLVELVSSWLNEWLA